MTVQDFAAGVQETVEALNALDVVTRENNNEAAAKLLTLVAREGMRVKVDGFEVVRPTFIYHPVTVWMNGTLSVTVKAKAPGKTRELYFKLGKRFPVVTVENA